MSKYSERSVVATCGKQQPQQQPQQQQKISCPCIIEIERHSREKYEYDHATQSLVLDRVLPYPYFYPYAYGFVPDTKADDGDELDVLLITEKETPHYKDLQAVWEGQIVGALLMEDEKGRDDKLLLVPHDEYVSFLTKRDQIYADIEWFFANYKSKGNDGKWSKVHGFVGDRAAADLYRKSRVKPIPPSSTENQLPLEPLKNIFSSIKQKTMDNIVTDRLSASLRGLVKPIQSFDFKEKLHQLEKNIK